MSNARQKGKRGERMWRDELNAAGFTGSSRGGQQYMGGGADNPDVICPALPRMHNEVKFAQNLSVRKAMEQSTDDAGENKVPIVAWKKNGEDWLVVIKAQDFFQLVKLGATYLGGTTNTSQQEFTFTEQSPEHTR